MKQLKPHFVYNRKQRNGVFYFMIFLVLVQFSYFLIKAYFPNRIDSNSRLTAYLDKIDSLKVLKKKSTKVFKFNPNYITDEKGYALGMSVVEIDRLLTYRKQKKWINSTKDFQRITKVSDSFISVLKPFFLFPKQFYKTSTKKIYKVKVVSPKKKLAINKATTEELKTIYGIGNKLSVRIVKYRTRLGGYTYLNQLDEVYGLKGKSLENVKQRYKVIESPLLAKINVNTASFKEVLSIVYLDYETTKLIFQYKNSVDGISDLKEIKKIQGFPIDKYDRIALYLQAE